MPAETHSSAVRDAFENMAPDDPRLALVGRDGENAQVESCHAAVRNLPIYAGRRFQLGKGMEGFLDGLPFLTKSDLRSHFPQGFMPAGENFAARVSSKNVEVVRTSGTSSDRLQVLWDIDWWERQELAALRGHPAMGPHLAGDYREAVLTTPLCSESVCKTGPATMEERRVDNLLFLNTQHDPSRWNKKDMARMAEEIEAFKPVAIEADPVYLAVLARHIRDDGGAIPKLEWILLTYEFVSSLDKSLVRAIFGCPVFEFYGLTEAGVFFLECAKGRHHFCGSDCVVEILRPGNTSLPPNVGEVLVTTWGNRAAPLLRYRTSDLVAVDPSACACGRPGPTVSRFEGRTRDVIEFPDGTAFTPRQIDDALSGVHGLAQYMCVQEQPEAVRVDYVRDGDRDPAETVRERLAALWKNARVRLSARRVPFIPPEPSGKYRTVVPK